MTHRKREFGEWRSALARDFGYAIAGTAPSTRLQPSSSLTLGWARSDDAIYALLDAVVLRPLPYPTRIDWSTSTIPSRGNRTPLAMSQAGYFFFRRNSKPLANIGVFNRSEATL